MTKSQPHPRTHRLGGRGTFVAVREQGVRISSGPMVMWAAPNDRKHCRLGISVGKMVGNAVVRNRLKRIMRECFRTLPPTDLPASDLVVQFRPHATADGAAYRKWWGELIAKAAARISTTP